MNNVEQAMVQFSIQVPYCCLDELSWLILYTFCIIRDCVWYNRWRLKVTINRLVHTNSFKKWELIFRGKGKITPRSYNRVEKQRIKSHSMHIDRWILIHFWRSLAISCFNGLPSLPPGSSWCKNSQEYVSDDKGFQIIKI